MVPSEAMIIPELELDELGDGAWEAGEREVEEEAEDERKERGGSDDETETGGIRVVDREVELN